MQIKHLATGTIQHIANEIGCALIAAGLAVEIPADVKKPEPDAKWAARRGNRVGDFVYPPYIQFSCGTCGQRGAMEGRNCHQTQLFRHCGVIDPVPEYIAIEFKRLLKEHDGKSRANRGRPLEAGASEAELKVIDKIRSAVAVLTR